MLGKKKKKARTKLYVFVICLIKIIIKKESKFSAISAIKGFILLFLRSVIEVGLATVRKENYRLETFFFFD